MSNVVLATYADRRDFSDRFLPQVIDILRAELAPRLAQFVAAPFDVDTTVATDLLEAPRDGVIHVAVRIRKHSYLKQYGGEFTVRDYTDFGGQTEFEKVMAGCATHGFYGFANDDDSGLAKWTLIDLDVFRWWCTAHYHAHGFWPGVESSNGQHRKFRAFRFNQAPAELVIARCEPPAICQRPLLLPPPTERADAAFAGMVAALGSFDQVKQAARRYLDRQRVA